MNYKNENKNRKLNKSAKWTKIGFLISFFKFSEETKPYDINKIESEWLFGTYQHIKVVGRHFKFECDGNLSSVQSIHFTSIALFSFYDHSLQLMNLKWLTLKMKEKFGQCFGCYFNCQAYFGQVVPYIWSKWSLQCRQLRI